MGPLVSLSIANRVHLHLQPLSITSVASATNDDQKHVDNVHVQMQSSKDVTVNAKLPCSFGSAQNQLRVVDNVHCKDKSKERSDPDAPKTFVHVLKRHEDRYQKECPHCGKQIHAFRGQINSGLAGKQDQPKHNSASNGDADEDRSECVLGRYDAKEAAKQAGDDCQTDDVHRVFIGFFSWCTDETDVKSQC